MLAEPGASAPVTEGERLYLAGARALYDTVGTVDQRRARMVERLREVARRWPHDDEARLFAVLYEMSLDEWSSHDSTDVLRTTAELEEIRDRRPSHPGALHYLIGCSRSGSVRTRTCRRCTRPGTLYDMRTGADAAGRGGRGLLLPFYVSSPLARRADWHGFLLCALSAGTPLAMLAAATLHLEGRRRSGVLGVCGSAAALLSLRAAPHPAFRPFLTGGPPGE